MSDDRLLEALGARAREWEALARGELDAEAVDALRREAETTAEGRRAWEAFRPLDPRFHARAARRILAARDDRPARAPDIEPAAARRRRATPRAAWALAAVLLASIAGGLLIGRGAAPPPLPSYQLSVAGVRAERAPAPGEEATAGATLVPGSRLELVLRPATGVEGPVTAALYLAGGGALDRWPVAAEALEAAPSGALRVAGRVGAELPFRAGDWTVLAVVGRPGAMPSPAAVEARWRAGEGAEDGAPRRGDWHLLTAPLRMVPGG